MLLHVTQQKWVGQGQQVLHACHLTLWWRFPNFIESFHPGIRKALRLTSTRHVCKLVYTYFLLLLLLIKWHWAIWPIQFLNTNFNYKCQSYSFALWRLFIPFVWCYLQRIHEFAVEWYWDLHPSVPNWCAMPKQCFNLAKTDTLFPEVIYPYFPPGRNRCYSRDKYGIAQTRNEPLFILVDFVETRCLWPPGSFVRCSEYRLDWLAPSQSPILRICIEQQQRRNSCGLIIETFCRPIGWSCVAFPTVNRFVVMHAECNNYVYGFSDALKAKMTCIWCSLRPRNPPMAAINSFFPEYNVVPGGNRCRTLSVNVALSKNKRLPWQIQMLHFQED